MSQLHNMRLNDDHRRAVFLFGAQPWNRDRVIKESLAAGLRVVLAKPTSDHSEDMLARLHQDSSNGSGTPTLPHATEILPEQMSALSGDILAHLRRDYGEDWCALPLNDYVTEYAAMISTHFSDSCYPPRSAAIVKRKHELRAMWNRLASQSASELYAVEYCYVERRNDDAQFEYYPGPGFDALPEKRPLMVKPDELSGSIEIHSAGSKKEAVALAREICGQLRSKWSEVGQSIGTEIRPRVLIETAIERSTVLHPGAEFSIEFVSFLGEHCPVGITQKWTGPNFIECGHFFPAESFPAHLKPALERAIRQLLEQLGVKYGVSHWEFIVTTDGRIALVEGHLRPAGDRIMELIEYSTGQSPTGALCEALARRKANFSFVPRTSCGIFWMVPQTQLKQVTEVTVNSTVTDMLCKNLHINQEGIKATPNWSHATDWIKRFAHVVATGDNLECITNCCREVARHVILSSKGSANAASTPLVLTIDQ